MNPKISSAMLMREQSRSDENYQREYLAKFTDSISAWIAPEILDPCIVRGREELPSQGDVMYAAAIDPATRHNDFALAILHLSREGRIVVDRLARWAGTKTTPVPFERVLGEIRSILEDYAINAVIGDQYYCDVIREQLLQLGIYYEICVFGPQTRARIFANLKHLLVQGMIELLDRAELLQQLRNLREVKSDRGQIDVRPSGGKDDLAVAVALAASELTKRPSGPVPFLMPGGELSRLQNPDDCIYHAGCANSPRCLNEDGCKGFLYMGLAGKGNTGVRAKLTPFHVTRLGQKTDTTQVGG
jgi:hypothetical protein